MDPATDTSFDDLVRQAAEGLPLDRWHLVLIDAGEKNAASVINGIARDWLEHAKGNRRRAHEYLRWAREYLAAGNLPRWRHYQKQYERSMRFARDALDNAKIHREISQ